MVVATVLVYEAVFGHGTNGIQLVGDIAFAAANGLVGIAVMMAQPKPPVQSDEDTVVDYINELRKGAKILVVAVVAIGAIFVFGGVAFAHDPDAVSNDDISYGVVCSTLPGAAHGCNDENAGEAIEAQQEESEPVEQVEVAVSDGQVLYEAEKTICIKAEANVWLYAIAEAAGIVDEGSESAEDEIEICQTFTISVSGGGFALVTTSVN